jgi:hypothetical protein
MYRNISIYKHILLKMMQYMVHFDFFFYDIHNSQFRVMCHIIVMILY